MPLPSPGRRPIGSVLPRALAALWLCAASAGADTFVWIDGHGATHVTNDAASVPDGATLVPEPERGGLWGGRVAGPPLAPEASSTSSADDRLARLLRDAADDLARGETGRAQVGLESVLADSPANAEAHWYLAALERQRGRRHSAGEHLRAFLSNAGDAHAPWRAAAQRQLEALEAENRLAAARAPGAPLRTLALDTGAFRLRVDADLVQASPGLAQRVLAELAEARSDAAARLGFAPSEATGVVIYGRAAYRDVHASRFTFPTVGFFDGEIHVSSAARPGEELRGLLFHELVHAFFRERTGGDRPYWLNEGLAELAGRRARGLAGLTRSERAELRARARDGRWIPLGSLVTGFQGLDAEGAQAAYLASAAAAEWLLARTTPATRARLLAAIGAGSADAALRRAAGVDTRGLDAALRRLLLSEGAPAALAPLSATPDRSRPHPRPSSRASRSCPLRPRARGARAPAATPGGAPRSRHRLPAAAEGRPA